MQTVIRFFNSDPETYNDEDHLVLFDGPWVHVHLTGGALVRIKSIPAHTVRDISYIRR